jgi:Protein-L-isoaspartate(D-aspartate) O-methyltransferase (PCMT)
MVIGYASKGPYDAIHVGAAARTIPPALLEQLASPGRMIIPVGTYSQRFMQVDKDAQGTITQKDLFGVVVRASGFVPNISWMANFQTSTLLAARSMCHSLIGQRDVWGSETQCDPW